jgi:hypothetical protein
MTQTIGLAEYIEKVKQDLLNEQYLSKDKTALLAIEEIEIELTVVATKEGGGSGKVSFKLGVPLTGEFGVEAGGEGKLTRENAQTLRVKLAPLITKEQILAKMTPAEKKTIEDIAVKYIARGGDDEARGSDRA